MGDSAGYIFLRRCGFLTICSQYVRTTMSAWGQNACNARPVSLVMLIINMFRRQIVRWWLKLFGKRCQVCGTSNIRLFDESQREKFEFECKRYPNWLNHNSSCHPQVFPVT